MPSPPFRGRSSILFQFSRTRRRPSGDLGVRRRQVAARSLAGPPGARIAVPRRPAAVCARSPAGRSRRQPSILDTASRPCSYRSRTSRTPLGILIVGSKSAPSPEQLRDVAAVGHAFAIALERTRVASESDLQLQLRNLLQEFSRTVSSKTLSAGLDTLCAGANRLFGADRTSVWLHDRRARMVVLSASSDVVYLARERRIPASTRSRPRRSA